MDDICEFVDKKEKPKRRAESPPTLDAVSIKKRLRGYQTEEPFLHLNDDCLMGIFEHLTQVDLCHVRRVNARFDPLVERVFRCALKKKPDWNKFEMAESTSDTRRIFYNFGHLFQWFHAIGNTDDDIFERLPQITSLTLERLNIDWKMIRKIHGIQCLKTLDLVNCTFDHHPKINTAPNIKYSTLQRLTFQTLLPTRIFSKLLQYSQQLRCLGLPIDVPESYNDHIQKYGQKLTEFILFANDNFVSSTVPNVLSDLKNVKRLTLSGYRTLGAPATSFLVSIKNNASQITHLEIKEFTFKKPAIDTISELKSLQHLTLTGMFDCEKTEFVSLVTALPLLTSLTFTLDSCCSLKCHSRDVNFNVMKSIVEAGKELNVLKLLHVRLIRIDGKAYAELLKVLEKRVRKEKLLIAIDGCGSTTGFDVPMHVQSANEKCLEIGYDVYKGCSCNDDCFEV